MRTCGEVRSGQKVAQAVTQAAREEGGVGVDMIRTPPLWLFLENYGGGRNYHWAQDTIEVVTEKVRNQ